jgi:bifunctional UDP-N-acetylglucosamine pyrophosphorylase/glucosamine-1-phosphate N-acetyltransferase/UDP-N-acetylglucosamine pyrophosphorylase
MEGAVAVVMAAGMGTRMKSDLPKVLFPVLGRPMIEFVLDALEAGGVERVIAVIGYRADDVRAALAGRRGIEYVLQTERLGTGHAVKMAAPLLGSQLGSHHAPRDDGISRSEMPTMVVAGDSPLIQSESVRTLLDYFREHQPACLLGTLHKPNPTGLGRIVRDAAGQFTGIVEEKDATDEQRKITEVNMSTYIFNGPDLLHALDQLQPNNKQGEYYLTDCPGILQREGKRVEALPVLKPCESLSINTIDELAQVEAEMVRLGYKGSRAD